MERRRFLRYVAAAPALTVVSCKRTSNEPRQRTARATDGISTFTSTERATLAALCARIIPSDDGPGAKEAGVIDYIEAEMKVLPARASLRFIRRGIRVFNTLAKQAGANEFSKLPVATQDKLMSKVEQRKTGKFPGNDFLRIIISMTIQGYLCDPVYGGNKGSVGWKYIAFVPRHPRPAEPYRRGAA